jgi:hypothetical protein
MYFRQVGERYGIGSYKHRTMAVSPDEIPRKHEPGREMPSIMPFTPEDFEGPGRVAKVAARATGD